MMDELHIRQRVDNGRETWDTPTMRWMQTYTGKVIDIANPKPEDIDIVDIAHALVRLCRYGGHVETWYSVAGHSLAMAKFAETLSDQTMLECLFHDATEAYLGDTISPVRKLLTDWTRRVVSETGDPAGNGVLSMLELLHERWQSAIWQRFGLCVIGSTVRTLDKLALLAEVSLVFRTVSPAFERNGYTCDPNEPALHKMQDFVRPYVQECEPGGFGHNELELEFVNAFTRWEALRRKGR